MGWIRLKGRWRRIGLAVAAGLLLAYFLTPVALRWVLRWRLQAMIAAELNAKLEIGGLSYTFPYAIDVKDAALVANGPDGQPLELLRVPHLGISLARSPLHGGPLVIETIQIDDPAIHLIKVNGGLIGRRGLVREDASTVKKTSAKPIKLSEMFRLTRLAMHGGNVIYEDRTLARTRPLFWSNLNIVLDTTAHSGSEYGFHFMADNSPLASLDAMGEADIDSFLLKLSHCTLSVNVDPTSPQSALPPEYQQLLQQMGVRGELVIKTAATLPLLDIQNKKFDTTHYDTTLELRQASAMLPQFPDPIRRLAAKVRLTKPARAPALKLDFVDAESGAISVQLTGGSIVLNPTDLIWRISGLSGRIDAASLPGGKVDGGLEFTLNGSAPLDARDIRQIKGELRLTPRNLEARSPLLATPVDQFTDTTITLANGLLSARQLRAAYGNDVWYIKQADVDLTKLPKQAIVKNAEGCLTFGTPRAKYPRQIEKALSQVNPAGPWFFDVSDSTVTLASPPKVDYHLLIHTARGRLALDDGKLPVYNINTAINITPELIQINSFHAGALKGEINLGGWMKPARQASYAIDASVRGADLSDLMRALQKPGQKSTPLFGRGYVDLHVDGFVPKDKRSVLDVITGRGTFEVRDGDFWRIPVMQDIAKTSDVNSALTVGEGAGVFQISDGALHLHPAAVSAPLLGVEGTGDITFKGILNLNLVGTPLGQWGNKAADSGVASVLNAAEKGFNIATGQALYHMHVSGTPNNPKVEPVLVPFLSQEAGNLANFLKDQSQNGHLLDFVKKQGS